MEEFPIDVFDFFFFQSNGCSITIGNRLYFEFARINISLESLIGNGES